MRRTILILLSCAVASLSSAAGASAASWVTPLDLSATGQSADSPQVAVAADGTTTAVWRRWNGSHNIIQASTRPAGGSFSAPVDLSATGQNADSPQVAVAADGTTTAVWRRYNGSHNIVQASTRPAGGSFGAPVDLSTTGQNAASPEVAAADGTTTAVWYRNNGTNWIVQASTRPAGGSFGAPVDLSATGQSAILPQVAVAADGTTTAVWYRSNGSHNIIQASTRPAGGSFSAPVDLSTTGQNAGSPQVAAADGTTAAVWSRWNGSNQVIQASTRPAGGSFGAPVDLSTTGQNADVPQVAVATDGTTTAVWRRYNGSNDIVQASTRPAGGSFGAPVDLSTTGQSADFPQVAVAADGTTAAVWRRGNSINYIVQASTRPAGGSFGAPVDLSATGQDAASPQVAVAADGTTTAVWRRSNGSNHITQAAVHSTAPVASAIPVITGSAKVAETLTCNGGTWTAAPTKTIAWLRDSTEIATGTTYTTTTADQGKALTCRATATNLHGSTTSTSAALTIPEPPTPTPTPAPTPAPELAPPAPTPLAAPRARRQPRITGRPKLGRTVRCIATFTNATKTTTTWLRARKPIPRASKVTYKITRRDLRRPITCRTTATGPGGRTTATSRAIRPRR